MGFEEGSLRGSRRGIVGGLVVVVVVDAEEARRRSAAASSGKSSSKREGWSESFWSGEKGGGGVDVGVVFGFLVLPVVPGLLRDWKWHVDASGAIEGVQRRRHALDASIKGQIRHS